jgi:hypothetical protein
LRTARRRSVASEEQPTWRSIALLYVCVVLVVVLIMSATFLAAKLATGHAY